MKSRLLAIWASRSPRERWVLMILGGAIVALLYGTVVISGAANRTRLQASVKTLRAEAIRLEQQAAEVGRLKAAPARSFSAVDVTDLKTVLEAHIGAAGLSRAVVKIDASDSHRVAVTFNPVAFADWSRWVDGLKERQIRVDSCRIESLPVPGTVKVTATLLRSTPP